jgi:transcriptional antiterminator RfaH
MKEDFWHVITTRPRAEKSVGSLLTSLNVKNFVPLHKQLRQWRDRKKWVELPLFPSYVFVNVPLSQRNKVFDAYGVIRYLRTGNAPAKLSEEEMERIQRLCSYNGEISIKAGQIKIGEEIEIQEGHFRGIRGIICEVGNQRKLKVMIKGLDCYAVIENYSLCQ